MHTQAYSHQSQEFYECTNKEQHPNDEKPKQNAVDQNRFSVLAFHHKVIQKKHAFEDMDSSDEETAERWYDEQGIDRDEIGEMFDEHIQEIQNPDHPLNVVGTSYVYNSSRQKVDESSRQSL